MGVLVQDDFSVQSTVPGWIWASKQIEFHPRRHSVVGRGEEIIVSAAAILNIYLHGVTPQPAAAKIIDLEITRGLGEAQFVKLVVIPIAPIKGIHDRRISIESR